MYDQFSPEELLREILAGEDSFLDFKEVIFQGNQMRFASGEGKAAEELAKDLSCFANTEGGVIIFGVRNDKERVGVPEDGIGKLQELILNVAQNNVDPPLGHLLLFDRVLLPDSANVPRLCLKLEIRKALYSVHAPRGRRPYHRLADQCHEMTMEQQARLFERRGMMMPFEERPVLQASLAAVDRRDFESYYERRYGHPLADAAVDYEQLLQNLKLAAKDEAGGLHPTALGLLMFSPRPGAYVSGTYVDIALYHGTEPDAAYQKDAKVIEGPVPQQIERTLDYLRLSPMVPVPATKDGLGRLDQPAYSLRALQEAVVNAIVHRDYSLQGAQVRVFLFPDRIEVSSPGRLHNSLTRADLFAGCQPIRRNQMLAGFLRDYVSPLTNRGYMEGRGEGFLTMVRECERVSGKPPDLTVVGDSVRLTIYSGAPWAAMPEPAGL